MLKRFGLAAAFMAVLAIAPITASAETRNNDFRNQNRRVEQVRYQGRDNDDRGRDTRDYRDVRDHGRAPVRVDWNRGDRDGGRR